MENYSSLNYETVRYGMLVAVRNTAGFHSGMKVHFYNKKGVLVGNDYKFYPYEKLYLRLDGKSRYQRFFYGKKFEKIKNRLFRIPLALVDFIIRRTEPILD